MTPEQQAWIDRDNAEWLRRQDIINAATDARMLRSIDRGEAEAWARVRWAMWMQTFQAVLVGLIVAVALWLTRTVQ